MPRKACERWFSHVMAFAYLFEMPQNPRVSFSVPSLFYNWSRGNNSKNPTFLCPKYSKCFFFPFHDQIKKEKWDISNISNIEKWGILNYSHVIKTENEPKMKLFDFGAFQINMKMPSHDKIIFHMLFGTFHITFRHGSPVSQCYPFHFSLSWYSLACFHQIASLFSRFSIRFSRNSHERQWHNG